MTRRFGGRRLGDLLLGLGLLVLSGLVSGGALAATGGDDCDRLVRPGESLQDAIDGLPDNGAPQTVCLAAGDFRLSDMVTLERDHVTLRGQGAQATRLGLAEGVVSPVLVLGEARRQVPGKPIHDVTVSDLAIRGSGAGGPEFREDLPYLSNSALIVRRGDGVTLRRLDIRECRSACLLTEYHSRDVTIEDNHLAGAQWDGLSLNRAGATRVVGNTIEHNVAAGITVEYLRDGEVIDNRLLDNGSHGIYLADAEHNVFRDNLFRGNRQAGVFLTCSIRHRNPVECWEDSFSRDNVFRNNRFVDNGHGFQVSLDDAANCRGFDTPPNLSQGDTFHNSPNDEPSWERYGHCIRYDGSREAAPDG